ncbi:DNA primase [Collinsella tanakaei]|uniref:DNA primase n=1 Tax=Collinsella tanakaei TaxID=626935 RepID=UPI0025A47B1C|nr:DNA primase [Collinsella tanakaei]MDM8245214.1 DNA primase [Collinsella tanakaei]
MISDEDKDRVRAATDLVQLVQETVELKPRGQEFWGCCPFHGEKTPSFHVIPATQVWHCFGCGEGGDAFTYVMKRENLSFPESIRYLADRAGIEIADDAPRARQGTKRSRIIDVCEEACAFFHTMLMRGKDGRGREYFATRGIGSAVCQRYRLGYAPGRGSLVAHLSAKGFKPREMIDANVAVSRDRGRLSDRFYDRVMFPIFDEQGRCIAFGGRIMGKGEPKYLNTAETPVFHKKRNLYGFNWAKEHIVAADEAIVVEGYTDAIACWEAGIKNVVATLGTALTEHHVKTLTRFAKRIVYLFDGDAAGQKAAERAIQFVETGSVDLRCVILPDDLDPADFLRDRSGEDLRAMLDAAEPLLDFVFRKLEGRSDVTTPAGRARALEDACRLIYPLRTSYMIDTYYMQIADRLGADPDMVREAATRVFRQVAREEETARNRERMRDRAQRDRSAATAPTPATQSAAAPGGGEPWGSEPFDEEPYDYVPMEADGGADAAVSSEPAVAAAPAAPLTELERRSLTGERELLCLLTSYPDSFRPFAERITEIDWIDSRHEAIAWAVLATPEGSSAADVMAAARSVCPEAPQLVSAGTIDATSAHPTETNIEFLLDTLELYTIRRRMWQAQARLRSDRSLTVEERRDMAIRATQDAARVRELERAVEGVADPFRQYDQQGGA